MTNKLKYFIGNWKMFGDFGSFKIISKINQFSHKYEKLNKKILAYMEDENFLNELSILIINIFLLLYN